MTKQLAPVVAVETPLDAAWSKVRTAFAGFIGNADAVHAVQRGLVAALIDARPGEPVVMAKTLLFSGPASVGKTHLANLVTTVLNVPLVRLDGRGLRNRDRLFDLIDTALEAHELKPKPGQARSGVQTMLYPSFAAFIDEIHLVGAGTQESLLTMLEQDDRTVLLDGKQGRRIAVVNKATFIFATTRPAEVNRALRTRCTEINTKNDYAYLKLLQHEGRALGEQAIRAHLQGEIDAAQISEDIEPFLFSLKLVSPTGKGRALTYAGYEFLDQARKLAELGA